MLDYIKMYGMYLLTGAVYITKHCLDGILVQTCMPLFVLEQEFFTAVWVLLTFRVINDTVLLAISRQFM